MNFDKLNEGERQLVKWQYRLQGDFYDALWSAISRADSGNLARLALAFPSDVEAYRRFSQVPGYWEEVQERAGIDPRGPRGDVLPRRARKGVPQ